MSNDVSFIEMLEKTESYIKKNKDTLKNLNSVESLIEYVFPIIRKLKNDIDSDLDEVISIIDADEREDDVKEIALSLIDYIMNSNMLIDILMIESEFVKIQEDDKKEKKLVFTDKFNENEKVNYLYNEILERQKDEMENLKILSGDLYISEDDVEGKNQTDAELIKSNNSEYKTENKNQDNNNTEEKDIENTKNQKQS